MSSSRFNNEELEMSEQDFRKLDSVHLTIEEADGSDTEKEETKNTFDVENWIQSCASMEFAWSTKKNDIRHTSVVLKFNQMPILTLDFGFTMGVRTAVSTSSMLSATLVARVVEKTSSPCVKKLKKLAKSLPFTSSVGINMFNSSIQKIEGSLVNLRIDNEEQKENAINLIKQIKRIEMGSYQMMTNNCRSYVIVIATLLYKLPEFTPDKWSKFEYDMTRLLSEDEHSFEQTVSSAKAVLVKIQGLHK